MTNSELLTKAAAEFDRVLAYSEQRNARAMAADGVPLDAIAAVLVEQRAAFLPWKAAALVVMRDALEQSSVGIVH